MGKLKSKKTITGRFRVTKTGKLMKKVAGQSHFNARESGKVGRAKRRDFAIAAVEQKQLKRFIHL
ncbi:MAG: 50S ribosomal protein L35 [Parcubacteria group bacterium]|nr:50S ribosomal protein L35 [Parcubacteria group bacterium]